MTIQNVITKAELVKKSGEGAKKIKLAHQSGWLDESLIGRIAKEDEA